MKHQQQQTSPDDPSAELRRLGVCVVILIVVWSVGWFAVHRIVEARQHAVAHDHRR